MVRRRDLHQGRRQLPLRLLRDRRARPSHRHPRLTTPRHRRRQICLRVGCAHARSARLGRLRPRRRVGARHRGRDARRETQHRAGRPQSGRMRPGSTQARLRPMRPQDRPHRTGDHRRPHLHPESSTSPTRCSRVRQGLKAVAQGPRVVAKVTTFVLLRDGLSRPLARTRVSLLSNLKRRRERLGRIAVAVGVNAGPGAGRRPASWATVAAERLGRSGPRRRRLRWLLSLLGCDRTTEQK